jgi:hypothetical protein
MTPVPEPSFAVEERRSFLVPALIAVAALVIGIAISIKLFPSGQVQATVTGSKLYAAKTVFHSDTIVIGTNETDETLFVSPIVKLDNELRTPSTFDDATMVLTDATGAQLTAKAAQKSELPNIVVMFPAVKSLIATPLLRETEMAPGASAQGALLFSFPVPQSVWDNRKSAEISIEIYHQPSVKVTVP